MIEAFPFLTDQPFGDAILVDDNDTLQALLKKDAGLRTAFGRAPEPNDSCVWLPLHLAAWTGAVGCLGLLLREGSKPDSRTRGFSPFSGRQTALMLACAAGHKACTQVLLEAGADANAQDAGGRSALSVSIEASSVACTALLLERDADVDLADYQGMGPLHLAVRQQDWSSAERLLKAGADPCRPCGRDPKHLTILLRAVHQGENGLPLAELLRDHDAWDALCATPSPLDHLTPLALATARGDTAWEAALSSSL